MATTTTIINCQNEVMWITFGNMTLELNSFHLSSKHEPPHEQEPEEVCLIGTSGGEHCAKKQAEKKQKGGKYSSLCRDIIFVCRDTKFKHAKVTMSHPTTKCLNQA